MQNPIRPLASLAATAALSLTLTATAAAQASPDTVRSAGPAETRYVLVDVGGKSLPVEVEKEWRCREEVTAGTLLLREDGRWRLETTRRETCGSRVETDQEDEDGIYRTEGATIHFLDDDGNRNDADWHLGKEIDLDDLDQGTLADGGTLSVRLADEETVLRFRKQGA